jgi:hypothetical protein
MDEMLEFLVVHRVHKFMNPVYYLAADSANFRGERYRLV